MQMATTIKSLSLFLVLLLLLPMSFSFFGTEAGRPINISMSKNCMSDGLEGLFDGLYLEAIKRSGPSPGVGHKYNDGNTYGDMKQSGPSPGEGHKYTDNHTLGGVKQSGPSPGAGHK
ncbi:hypothetical protein WN944_021305 [Citrus x changshan-huyou]|uniref:Transmembrane protein n=1 Tax=Citrus x changshan-huyou TaxID=2935761 RepID=A0AAP0MWL5_9ROSI